MFWGCFAASGTGCLERVCGIMNTQAFWRAKSDPVSESWVSIRILTLNTRQKPLRNGSRQNAGLKWPAMSLNPNTSCGEI